MNVKTRINSFLPVLPVVPSFLPTLLRVSAMGRRFAHVLDIDICFRPVELFIAVWLH